MVDLVRLQKRIKKEDSLFSLALEKLMLASQEELKAYLNGGIVVKSSILRPTLNWQEIEIKELDGGEYIGRSEDVFSGVDIRFSPAHTRGCPTKRIKAKIDFVKDAQTTFWEAFSALPGLWRDKCLSSENQVVEFCRANNKCGHGLGLTTKTMVFLVKINGLDPINENRPEDNLLIVCVKVIDEKYYSHSYCLYSSITESYPYYIVSPQLYPLEK